MKKDQALALLYYVLAAFVVYMMYRAYKGKPIHKTQHDHVLKLDDSVSDEAGETVTSIFTAIGQQNTVPGADPVA